MLPLRFLRFKRPSRQTAPESYLPSPILVPDPIAIYFSQRAFVVTLLSIVVVLVVFHLITIVDRFLLTDIRIFPNYLFDLNGEANFPAYFSSILLLMCAVLLSVIAQAKQQIGDRFLRHWQALALIFVALAVDEALVLHEKAIEPLKQLLNADGLFYYTWVVPAIFLVAVLLLTYWKFLLALPAKTRRGILLAGGLYICGTVGSEMVSGLWASLYDMHNFAYGLMIAAEEAMEMVGLVIFMSVLLSLLKTMTKNITFQLGKVRSQH